MTLETGENKTWELLGRLRLLLRLLLLRHRLLMGLIGSLSLLLLLGCFVRLYRVVALLIFL